MENINENFETSDEDEIALTAAEIIQLMEEAWTNEKLAPEILPHKSEIVDCLLEQLNTMEENLRNLDRTDFQKTLHQIEVDRLRFLVSSYLRVRLEKLETYALHILKEEEKRAERHDDLYLTPSETEFAKNYIDGNICCDLIDVLKKKFFLGLDQHFGNVLNFYSGVRNDWKNQLIVPNLDSFVFLKSKSNIEGVAINNESNEDEGDLVDFKTGSQMIISYKCVANLLKNDDVQLI